MIIFLLTVLLALPVLAEAQTRTKQVNLSWRDNADNESGFRLYRNNVKILELVGANIVSATDTVTGTVGQQFSYQVSAFNSAGESPRSLAAVYIIPNEAPAGATTLTATIAGQQATLRWVDRADNETGFKIMRDGAEVGRVAANVLTYVDTVPGTAGVSYNYSVVAFNALGDAPASNIITVIVPQPIPSPPSELKTSALSSSQIEVTWKNNATGSGNQISRVRSDNPNDPILRFTTAAATRYVDGGLRRNTEYCYEVRAMNGQASSGSYGRSCARTRF